MTPPTLFGNYTPGEHFVVLGELQAAEWRIEELRLCLDEARAEADRNRVARGVAALAKEILAREVTTGHIDEIAQLQLADEVAEPLRAAKIDQIKRALRDTVRQEAELEVNDPAWIERVRAEYDSAFETNGTYQKIRGDAEANARVKVIQELKTQAAQEETARLAADGVKEASLSTLRNHPDVQAQLRIAEAQARDTAEAELAQQAIDEGRARIRGVVYQGYEGRLEEAARKWVKSYEGGVYLKKETAARDKRLGKEAEEAGRRLIDGKLLSEEELRRQYLFHFASSGVPLGKIPENLIVNIVLGETKKEMRTKAVGDTDSYGNYLERWSNVECTVAKDENTRKITLVSHGDGQFFVIEDSIRTHKSPYAAQASLKGRVVALGKLIEKDGDVRMEQTISKGEVLHMDNDTVEGGSAMYTSLLLPVANISIGGVSAVRYFEM